MKNKGTTLVEIMIATLIFTVALAALLGCVTAILYLVDTSREQAVAISDLRTIMERIRATSFSNIPVQFPDGVADGGGINPYDQIVSGTGNYSLSAEQITVTYTDVNADPLEIRVTVSWQDKRGGAQSVSASTFRTR